MYTWLIGCHRAVVCEYRELCACVYIRDSMETGYCGDRIPWRPPAMEAYHSFECTQSLAIDITSRVVKLHMINLCPFFWSFSVFFFYFYFIFLGCVCMYICTYAPISPYSSLRTLPCFPTASTVKLFLIFLSVCPYMHEFTPTH